MNPTLHDLNVASRAVLNAQISVASGQLELAQRALDAAHQVLERAMARETQHQGARALLLAAAYSAN